MIPKHIKRQYRIRFQNVWWRLLNTFSNHKTSRLPCNKLYIFLYKVRTHLLIIAKILCLRVDLRSKSWTLELKTRIHAFKIIAKLTEICLRWLSMTCGYYFMQTCVAKYTCGIHTLKTLNLKNLRSNLKYLTKLNQN